ncbi:MAG: hypothetical protein GY899_18305 [Verrucomicrobiaceae bacterium]|nr:hypothetical protein [Verrucomicrobiaceae bacterium]
MKPVPLPPGKTRLQGAIKVPLGVRESKPAVPSVEKLIEKSRDARVEADRAWIVIDHAGNGGVSVIDLNSEGECYLIERGGTGNVETFSWIVRGGNTIPRIIVDNMMDLACRKSVLFGVGGAGLLSRVDSGKMRLGVAANNGRSVHTSRSAGFNQYPAAFREGVLALLTAARALPLTKSVKGMVSAEFIDPRQARRLTVLEGKTLVAVRDPGKDAVVLSPVVAAARMPGRKVVAEKEEDWNRILSYLSGGTGQITGDHCLISLGVHTYRLFVEPIAE